jgi:hypothetical protein
MAAFSASRLVWSAMSLMTWTTLEICSEIALQFLDGARRAVHRLGDAFDLARRLVNDAAALAGLGAGILGDGARLPGVFLHLVDGHGQLLHRGRHAGGRLGLCRTGKLLRGSVERFNVAPDGAYQLVQVVAHRAETLQQLANLVITGTGDGLGQVAIGNGICCGARLVQPAVDMADGQPGRTEHADDADDQQHREDHHVLLEQGFFSFRSQLRFIHLEVDHIVDCREQGFAFFASGFQEDCLGFRRKIAGLDGIYSGLYFGAPRRALGSDVICKRLFIFFQFGVFDLVPGFLETGATAGNRLQVDRGRMAVNGCRVAVRGMLECQQHFAVIVTDAACNAGEVQQVYLAGCG